MARKQCSGTHHYFSCYFHPLLFNDLWASEWVVQVFPYAEHSVVMSPHYCDHYELWSHFCPLQKSVSLTKAGGKSSPTSTITLCCLFILVETCSCKVLSPPCVAREPHGFTFASLDFPDLPTFFFKGVHRAYFQFLFAFRWIKTYKNLMNFHVVLVQGPCSSLYCSAVNTCAAEVSTLHRILNILLSL